MGSMITLGIDKFDIDWGKNNIFTDHSCLFLPSDIEQIPYYYADNIIEIKEGLSRKLGSMKRRLDLLGYSFQSLKERYEHHVLLMSDYSDAQISYQQFCLIFSSIDLQKIEFDTDNEYYDWGEYVSHHFFRNSEISERKPKEITADKDLGAFFENMDPYITLRILAENEKNADRLVQWRFADVVDNGWIDRAKIFNQLPNQSKILIVTEGSSDTFIIQRSMMNLYPVIADFFNFVDMEENYPFTGTGNLFKFCQGISRINIQNNVLVIFDNDAAGIEKFNQCCNLRKPNNLHFCRLPDHEYFSKFKTIGPGGESVENINGSAVSIECFLDMSMTKMAEKRVRWTSYNRELKRYQGEIENKDHLVRVFKNSNLKDGSYETEGLKFLMDYIIDQWVTNIL